MMKHGLLQFCLAHEIRRSSSAQLIHALWTLRIDWSVAGRSDRCTGSLTCTVHVQYVVVNGVEDDQDDC